MTRGEPWLRTPYQGVVQIVRFNWRFYAFTLAGCLVAALAAWQLPFLWMRASLWLGILATMYLTAASLAVSHYVYDRSGLYRMEWLLALLPNRPERWINIHAGLDETSPLLRSLLPGGQTVTLDIYDAKIMTEPAIAVARQTTVPPVPCIAAQTNDLPLSDSSYDTAFLIFAAHELRAHEARVQFFVELARVLQPEGSIVLVEHLRDAANFAAFGPGAMHFLSRATWERTFMDSGWRIVREAAHTPFVHAFVLGRAE